VKSSKIIKLLFCICSDIDCEEILHPRFLEAYISDKEYIEKYSILFNYKFPKHTDGLFLCKCNLQLKYKRKNVNIFCPFCKEIYCLTCLKTSCPKNEVSVNCLNIEKLNRRINELSLALKTEVKQCPGCRSFIFKQEEECNQVECPKCFEQFYFCCLKLNYFEDDCQK